MVICPKCQSEHCIKNGFKRERQRYKCEKCDHQWLGEIERQTDWKLLDGTPITQVAVANFLHITDRELRYLIKEMPQHAKNNLLDALQWYFRREIMVTDEDGNVAKLSDLKEEKLFHDTRKARHDANRSKTTDEKERHQLDIEKGIYVEREIVEQNVVSMSKEFSKKLFALPDRVVSLIMQAKGEVEVKKILNDELRNLTEEIDKMEVF